MNRENFPKFDSYACIGETVEWTAEGFDFVARLEFDGDVKPTDFDCYEPEDIERWNNDEWCYVGVVLSVFRNGIELSDHAASLWGIDCNYNNTSNAYLSEVAQELESEALDVARAEVVRIREALDDDHALSHADRAQFYGPSVRI